MCNHGNGVLPPVATSHQFFIRTHTQTHAALAAELSAHQRQPRWPSHCCLIAPAYFYFPLPHANLWRQVSGDGSIGKCQHDAMRGESRRGLQPFICWSEAATSQRVITVDCRGADLATTHLWFYYTYIIHILHIRDTFGFIFLESNKKQINTLFNSFSYLSVLKCVFCLASCFSFVFAHWILPNFVELQCLAALSW